MMLKSLNSLMVSQGIDVKSMGRIFIGLVKCGAWGCFDEFNRLEEAVLSAVSMQIQTIQAALRARSPHCDLLDRQVSVYLLKMKMNSQVHVQYKHSARQAEICSLF